MRILVVNAGSRSVKLRVVEAGRVVSSVDLQLPVGDVSEQLAGIASRTSGVEAVAHRVVHGGSFFTSSVVVDDDVRRQLDAVSSLAPLHNPPALLWIDTARRLFPGVPSVACFDTAFHATLPPEASTYAVPAEWVARWGIRRYGFHGLSCAWSLRRIGELTGRSVTELRILVCHLGGGGSVTAITGGRSVDTTMGFTPLEGLVMATRSGDLDPGALLWAVRNGLTAGRALEDLESRSGLLGLTGGKSADMRQVLAARADGDESAALAIGVYVHRLRAKIAAMAAAARGADVLVFTGGVGENSADIRAETCAGLGWMGVGVAPDANHSTAGADRDISASGSTIRTYVVHAKEELQMETECSQLLKPTPGLVEE